MNEWCEGWLFRSRRRRVLPLLRFSLTLPVVHGVYDLNKGLFKADSQTIGEAPSIGEELTLAQGTHPPHPQFFDVRITDISYDPEQEDQVIYSFQRG